MARRPSPRRSKTRGVPRPETAAGRPGWVWPLVLVVAVGVVAGAVWAAYRAGAPARRRARADAAVRASDWPAALAAWRAVNATAEATGSSWLAQARAAVSCGRLGEAQQALETATALDPASTEAWRFWIELLRVQDRATDAQRVGWRGYAAVPPGGRRAVLRDLTFALLADLPDDMARSILTRWAAAETQTASAPATRALPRDPEARVALLQRMGAMPRAGDPDRAARIAEFAAVLERDPADTVAREAIVSALLDGGDAEGARVRLDAWPAAARDARYWRLRGRHDLEFAHRDATGPDAATTIARRAEEAFRQALGELPHDWKTRVRLARTLRILGREPDARAEAAAVARLRERLDPSTLTPRLTRAEPADLADLASTVGLTHLANAWRQLARQQDPRSPEAAANSRK